MNKRSAILLVGLLLSLIFCQASLAWQVDRGQNVKYWVFLKDKADYAGKAASVEADYLSPRTLERRARRGVQRAAPQSISFDTPLSPSYLSTLQNLGLEPIVRSRWLNAVSVRMDDRMVERVRELPFVREVRSVGRAVREGARQQSGDHKNLNQPMPMIPPVASVRRFDYGDSFTQLNLINAIPALERGINGTGVVLGFLDTNFDGFRHAVFAQMVNDERVLADSNFTGLPVQDNKHARSVASVAVGFMEGELIGPAHGAMVVGATTEFAPTETNQEEDNFVAGLEWMESKMGVDVVNASIGYTTFDAGGQDYTKDDLDGDTGVTTRAADIAVSLGVVIVAAAGNEGNNFWKLVITPADGDSVIAVGAVDASGVRASFSSFGPTADGRIKPDLSAMGLNVRLVLTNGAIGISSGTSFSSPIVAGVVAQILQVNPDLNPIEIRDLLRQTASLGKLGPGNENNSIGWGIIDADAAITRAEELATAVEEDPDIPDEFEVLPPYPNPFSDQTVFEIRVPDVVKFSRLEIYNLLGQQVAVPFEGALQPGVNRIVFDATGLPAGLYLYSFRAENVSSSGKIVLVR